MFILRRALGGKKRGITWRLQETLEDMEYADDVCLVSHKYEHMQRKLDDLWKESKKAGLEINSSKTEVCNSKIKNANIYLKKKKKKQVNARRNAIYLNTGASDS